MDALTDARISPWLSRTSPGLRLHLFHFVRATVGVGHPGFADLWKALRERELARNHPSPAAAKSEVLAFRRFLANGDAPVEFERFLAAAQNLERIPVQDDAQDLGVVLSAWFRRPVWVFDAGHVEGPLELVPSSENQGGGITLLDARGKLADLARGVVRARSRRGRQGILVAMLDAECEPALDAAKLTRQARNWYESITGAALASHRVCDSSPSA